MNNNNNFVLTYIINKYIKNASLNYLCCTVRSIVCYKQTSMKTTNNINLVLQALLMLLLMRGFHTAQFYCTVTDGNYFEQ